MVRLLSSLQIGKFSVPPVFLAPMAGITDQAFRATVRDFGVIPTMTEMVAAEACLRRNPKTLQMLRFSSEETPKIVQLVGKDPDRLAEAAKASADQGADILNINMGCPARKIAQGAAAGAALMRDPSLAKQIFHAVRRATPLPVTVKMRLGWDAQQKNASEIARIAEGEGLALLIIHGRTRAQFYTGQADWIAVGQIKKAVHIPVLVNGDIQDAETARAALEASGADGLMIGRATLGAPWLPNQLKLFVQQGISPTPLPREIRLQTTFRHINRLIDLLGEEKALFVARKHLCWYSRGQAHAATFRARAHRAASLEEIWQYLEDLFALQNDP
ncbi:MAG: tRNA dihydrouridine synthase DusB [Holosporales bacterium]|jgi:tRNA-dihydrouridine synthase B|nr:tRNA dihydrouridine synthase DusB [Holosporales bacterium]